MDWQSGLSPSAFASTSGKPIETYRRYPPWGRGAVLVLIKIILKRHARRLTHGRRGGSYGRNSVASGISGA
jgi:hypothetical protein